MRILLAIGLAVTFLLAGPPGLASLKIVPGVREAGMAGAGAASATGPQAIAVNPAAGAGVRAFSAAASYVKWSLDSYHSSAFIGRKMSLLNVGLGVTSFSAGSFEHRTKPSEEPLGTFTPTDVSAYLNLSRCLGSMVQAGLTARYYYSRIMGDDASGFGLDGGVRVTPLSGLTLGASVVDFGKTASYRREVFWMPTRARLGASYELVPFHNARATVAADGVYSVYTSEADIVVGGEFSYNDVVALRAGYDIRPEASRLAFGLGLRAGILRVDYALTTLGFDMGAAHRISVGLGR